MITYLGIDEESNRELMRIAGVVRKHGWPEFAQGAAIGLQGPTFSYHSCHNWVGKYPKAVIENFMKWQEGKFK
jgi:hypothetical protein